MTEALADVSKQRAMVALERQNIVAPLVDDLLSDMALTIERIGGHNSAFQRQHFQQLDHRLAFVRLGVGSNLREH